MKKLILILVLIPFNAFSTVVIVPAGGGGGGGNQNQVVMRGYNGLGSTNTKIVRFDSEDAGTGADFTVAQSVANGDSITIGTTGFYCVAFTGTTSGANAYGVSVNSSELTTNIQSITSTDIFVYASSNGGGVSATRCAQLSASDVLRAHTAGTAMTDAGTTFTVVRID